MTSQVRSQRTSPLNTASNWRFLRARPPSQARTNSTRSQAYAETQNTKYNGMQKGMGMEGDHRIRTLGRRDT